MCSIEKLIFCENIVLLFHQHEKLSTLFLVHNNYRALLTFITKKKNSGITNKMYFCWLFHYKFREAFIPFNMDVQKCFFHPNLKKLDIGATPNSPHYEIFKFKLQSWHAMKWEWAIIMSIFTFHETMTTTNHIWINKFR